ncbi:MAG: SPFH domain-containing protein [Gemmataceae bacterium]
MNRTSALPRLGIALGVCLAITIGGFIAAKNFWRPFDVPEFAEVDTSESAFLIPLEGDISEQAAFPSVQLLNERKIATKRVQILHRWQQTGRMPGHGHYLPTMRLIKVDRRPITREWTQNSSSGTSSKDEAIHVESKDSINLSIGITVTANIPEDQAAQFLYSYPSKLLTEMLDMEVRARVQQVIADECAKYVLDELPKRKTEVIQAVRQDVIPFFKERGIQITSIGMRGGLHYANPEIQKSIDDSAKAAQLKVVAEAKRESQEVENRRLKMEAEGRAEAVRLEAKAKADAEGIRAGAEAEAIKKLADARAYEAEKAAASPSVYVQLRQLEADSLRWKLWDGKFPTHWMNSATPMSVLFPPFGATGLESSAKK